MRVCIAHNRYRSAQVSGENIAVEREIAALVSAGLEVVPLLRESDALVAKGWWAQLRTGLALAGSASRRQELVVELSRLRPTVLHVHNLFPMFGTDLWEAAAELHIPVVQTVHNHRLLATAAYFLGPWGKRRPRTPEELAHLARLSPLHGGRLTDALYLRGLRCAWQRGLPNHCVAAWVVHSPFHKDLLLAVGIPEERIVVRLHSLVDPQQVGVGPGDHALFVGRLKHEKGIDLLAAGWPRDIPLAIAGDGPEIALAKQLAGERFRGPLGHQAVAREMGLARFLIVTSRVYEGGGLPLVALEALAAGTPVLAPALGALPALIAQRGVGWCFDPSQPQALARAAHLAWTEAPALRARCRAVFEADHCPTQALHQLQAVYRAVAAGMPPGAT